MGANGFEEETALTNNTPLQSSLNGPYLMNKTGPIVVTHELNLENLGEFWQGSFVLCDKFIDRHHVTHLYPDVAYHYKQ